MMSNQKLREGLTVQTPDGRGRVLTVLTSNFTWRDGSFHRASVTAPAYIVRVNGSSELYHAVDLR